MAIRDHKWFTWLVISLYIGAIVLANYLITRYGQAALPFVAFTIIPFDLIARDLMQDRWQNAGVTDIKSKFSRSSFSLRFRMMVLILAGASISWLTGTGSFRINAASCLAFIISGAIDAITYQWMIRYGRIFRINAATLTGAISDSIIFVTIAFNEVIWSLVGLQIGMKVAGGFVWSLLLFKFFRKSFDLREPVSPFDPKHQIPILPDPEDVCLICKVKFKHHRYSGRVEDPPHLFVKTEYTITQSAASTGSLQDG